MFVTEGGTVASEGVLPNLGGNVTRDVILEYARAVRRVWEASDRLCSKRLAPFIGELVPVLERHDEIDLAPEVRTQLLAMSASTMDRVLKAYRTFNLRRPYTTRKSPGALKAQIPIRTFGEWGEGKPGWLQGDLGGG